MHSAATVCKVFAVGNKYLMLLKVQAESGSFDQESEIMMFTGSSLVPSRILDRATGVCL